jgi:site-specific DNA-methyltransferase (adenine-specific)
MIDGHGIDSLASSWRTRPAKEATMPDWTLHHGDALTILPTLSTPIDAVIADPPYNSGGRTMTERTSKTARQKYLTEGGRHHGFDLGDFTGDNRDQRSYLAWLSLILAECYRITRPQPGRLRQDCEFIVWGSNGAMIPGNDPVYLPGHFTGSQPRGKTRQHITQKPEDVMRELVRITPKDGTVLDPFTGSGTTGAAALLEGRNFLGIESSEQYAAVARQRLATAA